MKNSMQLCLIILVILAGFQTQAQVKFGVKAGLNLNNVSQNTSGGFEIFEVETKARLAYHIGVVADYAINDVLSLQSGLLLTSKGFSYDLETDLLDGETVEGYDRVIVNYLEIPISFAYKFDAFQVYAGPYLALGLGGKNKWDFTYSLDGDDFSDADEYKYKAVFGEVTEEDLDSDDDFYRAFDAGINFGVGYQVGPVLVNAGYSLGLGNWTPKYEGEDFDPADFKISNRVVTFSVSYFFSE